MNWVMLVFVWWSVCTFWLVIFRGHLGSCDVIRGANRFLANNSRLKRARDKGLVSMWLYCHDASTDIQHDLFGSTFDLMWDFDLRSNVDLTLLWSPCIQGRIHSVVFLGGEGATGRSSPNHTYPQIMVSPRISATLLWNCTKIKTKT